MAYEYSPNTTSNITSSNEIITYVTRTNLYTSGGEYLLPSGKEYVGFYHVHPEKGPMVGATHQEGSHDILFPTSTSQPPQISTIELSNYSYEDYSEKDLKLISPSTDSISEFRPSIDRVEFSVYTEQGLLDTIEYNYTDYTIPPGFDPSTGAISNLTLDPGNDLIKEGYTQGLYQIVYNFLRDKISSSPESQYYISQISADRTELRLASNTLSNEEIEKSTNSFIQELNTSPFFEDFFLNFGNNSLITGIRIALDDENNPDQFSVIVKLYEALPTQYGVKDSVWVSLQTAEAVSFDVEFAPKVIQPQPPQYLKGPNFDIQGKDITNNSTVFKSANELITTVLTSSHNELQNILNQKGAKVSIDYEDYNNFIYFSSAQSRLKNFYYKAKEIEDYQSEIDLVKLLPNNTATSASQALLEGKITNIISNFDNYENFLYFTSGSSKTWPKSNNTPPYTLYSTSSGDVISWYGDANEISPLGQLGTASSYDRENTDRLVNSLPEYVKNNSVNTPFFNFMDMAGQHFDVFWTYTKAIGDRYDADNRLDYGISKDIVADAIRSMGVTLYQNNFSSNDLSSAFIGINESGSLLPPTGSEVINNYVTASSDIVKLDNVNKETYKRIFHNLPFLLKKKGTVSGLRGLINAYGIPDTILRISEFGGKDIDNSNDWDYTQNVYNKAAFRGSFTSNFISTSFQLNSTWGAENNIPGAIRFRFKPTVSFEGQQTQSIVAQVNNTNDHYILFDYSSTGLKSGSYSGSIPSASNLYASLSFNYGTGTEIAAVNAPFYDGNWWAVQLIRASGSREYTLSVANSIYEGSDGFKIGYTASNSGINSLNSDNQYTGSQDFYLPSKQAGNIINGYRAITGSFQELRFYKVNSSSLVNDPQLETSFHDFAMNPYSIEGINYSSSAEDLVFRAPLGSNLTSAKVGEHKSIHPKSTGSLVVTSSFTSNSNYEIGAGIEFINNTEFIYQDQPAVGIKNRVSEKIRSTDLILTGSTLTPYRTIQQRYANSESYTRDVNYVEVAFSPQNEINDDINSSFGYFNIGDYIGDPKYVSESSTRYKPLDKISYNYFGKYDKPYDWRDYIRLIKYFDNSLFKMIKDFVPSKASVSTGVVIKQHILERNRQRPAIAEWNNYSTLSASIDVSSGSSFVSGGGGGIFDPYNHLGSGQEWSYILNTKDGTLEVTQSDQREFYNGELSGSEFRGITQEVGPPRLMSSSNGFFTGSKVPITYTDPLLNNVSDQVTSSLYYNIDYGHSYIVASNLDLILSGSASKAEVANSLFSQQSWTIPRYKGTRISSQNFNQTF